MGIENYKIVECQILRIGEADLFSHKRMMGIRMMIKK